MTIDHPDPPTTSDQPKTLILMRHAKSDWSDTSQSDHERPLNERGRESAPRMARWLADVGATPDLVLSSSSARTRETIERMLSEWSADPVVAFSDDLYLATPKTILSTIRSEGGAANTLLVLAHNPGMSDLVSNMADDFMEMPTAAAAVFHVEIDSWPSLRNANQVTLANFMRPKALN